MPAFAGDSLARRPLRSLRGVGPRLAERLARLRLESVQDLLWHLPLRYEDRGTVVPIGSLRPDQQALIDARVELAEVVRGRRPRLVVRVSDGSGQLTLLFFNFYPNQIKQFRRGVRIRAFGEVRPGLVTLTMAHPDYQLGEPSPATEEAGLVPVYPTTEGLNQTQLRRLVRSALELAQAPGALDDLLPPWLRQELGVPPLLEALRLIHAPSADADLAALVDGSHPAVRRLAFEELLAHHLSLLRLRQKLQEVAQAPRLTGDGVLRRRFLESLPFQLTSAQQRVDAEIARDLASSRAMLRLVQGDVGSGKTVVAALAALRAVESGWQAAVMAPTELLAEQHFRNFSQWLGPLGVEIGWLSGRMSGRQRESALAAVASGEAAVVVGTHALFQESVHFHRLGLVIVDEQHRFGVHQRLALREKGERDGLQPHQLIMTATPIPRTLAMTAYADLDVSVIDELPPGRTPVTTVAVPNTRRQEVIARVRAACAEGRQAYWVCTLIEESEALQAQAAAATAERLTEELPELRVGLVHGRLKNAEKEAVMAAFAHGELDLLVATTVIEVGVDVPNASLMIIENAERLGLAQLHQLRGRVGRGAVASSCVLMYQPPLSAHARLRLGIMRESNDGFEIAQRDLELRGPGEFLGTRQTGELRYRVADLVRDAPLLPQVQRGARRLLEESPQLAQALIARWVGSGERYAQV
ncbi:MAG: ATP-dependent DNA helicase RecG [Xanthomonadaceae bacterium]|nr:ATP-dependent DNA helicase RecG [Xanthomonadaceae bacterium]